VPAAQVLHERVPGRDSAQRSGGLHAAHRRQPSLELAVISFPRCCSSTARGRAGRPGRASGRG
jgi:hypothetical protein